MASCATVASGCQRQQPMMDEAPLRLDDEVYWSGPSGKPGQGRGGCKQTWLSALRRARVPIE